MTLISYTSEAIRFMVDFVKYFVLKIDLQIKNEKDAARLEYSMKGFRHFCYLRERALVV